VGGGEEGEGKRKELFNDGSNVSLFSFFKYLFVAFW
jgi:hypothetical protein